MDILISRFDTLHNAITLGNKNTANEPEVERNLKIFNNLYMRFMSRVPAIEHFIQSPSHAQAVALEEELTGYVRESSILSSTTLQVEQAHTVQLREEMIVNLEGYEQSLVVFAISSALFSVLVLAILAHLSKTNQKLNATIGMAASACMAKSTFLASMSHEFRTPLNAVSGFTQLIAMHVPEEKQESIREYSEAIEKSVADLVSLIDQSLELDEMLQQRNKLDVESIRTASVIRQVVKKIRKDVGVKKISLHFSSLGANSVIKTDSGKLTQALHGLLSNAIKFNHENGNVWISNTNIH